MEKMFLKRWIIASIIIIFTFIIAIRTSIAYYSFLFWFFMAVAGCGMASLCISRYSAKFKIRRRFPERVDEGDTLLMEMDVENTGFLPIFNIILVDHAYCAPEGRQEQFAVIDYIAPGYSMTLRNSCVCYKRGKYDIGPCTVYFLDFFGLFFFKRDLPDIAPVYVYPRMFPIAKFPQLVRGTAPWFGIGATQSSGDGDEFFGIREYKPGDPVKSIHWISTARKNKFIVKEFQRQNFYRATVIFNLAAGSNIGEGNETVAEYIVKITASVVRYLLDHDISVELIAHTGEIVYIPSNKGREHLDEILKVLTIAQPESNVGIGEIFEEFMRFIPEDSNLIVVMADTDFDVFMSSEIATKRDVAIIPVIILASSFSGGYQTQENTTGAKVKFTERLDFSPVVVSAGNDLTRVFSG